ncbi:Non-motile and phage-resistance protein [compost metagenome]
MRITLVETYATFAPDVVRRCMRWIKLPAPLSETHFVAVAQTFLSDLLEIWIRQMQDEATPQDMLRLSQSLETLQHNGIDYPHLLALCFSLPREVRDAYREVGVQGEDEGIWVLDELVHGLLQQRALETWNCLATRSHELEEASRQLKDLDMVRRNLLANVTHELRTPLSGILGYGEILEEELTGRLSAEQHELLQRLLADGYRLREVINTMLDMSQITAGKLSLDIQPLDLRLILQPACEQQLDVATAKPLSISLNVEPDLPLVRGDPNHVYQIVANLLSNAVKFTPPGGEITIHACMKHGEEWLKREGRPEEREANPEAVVVDVHDTGIGLAPDKLKMLFTSFYQADPSATRQFGGMGLGLSLVKSLVELHGGRVWAESTLGEGSTFSFSLPAWTSDDTMI